MTEYRKIVDRSTPIIQNYYKLVYCRGIDVKELIPVLRWSWLCFVELLFGNELLENFVTTSSNSGCPEEPDPERQYGDPNQLNSHIPSGFFTNLFRSQLLQVMYYKFYLQYKFIVPVAHPHEDAKTNVIDVTRIRFRLRKSLLYLVIPFRRVYLVSALAAELVGGALVWFVTTNGWYGAAAGLGLEVLRRLFRV